MKKILLGATALTFVGMAGAASAQNVTTSPFNLDIGGSATLGIGFADTEVTDKGVYTAAVPANGGADPIVVGSAASQTDGQPVTLVNNMEIHFNFSLVADNGLTFGYKMELEGDGTQSDEYVGFVSGSFGRVEIGVEDGGGDRFNGFYAGNVFTNAADGAGLLFDYASNGVATPDTGYADTGDTLKITYFTPTIAGFRAAATYAPASGNESGISNDNRSDAGEAFEFGARYDNTFGAFSVGLGASVTIFDEDFGTEDTYFGGGVVLGYQGFTVSGIYGQDARRRVGASSGPRDDYDALGIGLSYETGPWLFGGHYAQTLSWDAAEAAGQTDAEDSFGLSAEVVYTLAPGVRTGVVAEYASDSYTSVNDGAGNAVETNGSAFAAGLFLGLTF